jgi:hypothetical protein
MASKARKVAGKIGRQLYAVGGHTPTGEIRMPLKSARDIVARVLEDEWSDDFGAAVELMELRHHLIAHADGLEQVVNLLDAENVPGAKARMEGVLVALRVLLSKQVRDTQVRLRRGQLKKKGG